MHINREYNNDVLMQAAVVRVGYKVSPYLSTRTSKNAHFV